MKDLDTYLKKQYKLVIASDPDEDGYVAFFPDLKGCLSCGETIKEAAVHACEAKEDWIRAASEDGYPIPDSENDDLFSGQF